MRAPFDDCRRPTRPSQSLVIIFRANQQEGMLKLDSDLGPQALELNANERTRGGNDPRGMKWKTYLRRDRVAECLLKLPLIVLPSLAPRGLKPKSLP